MSKVPQKYLNLGIFNAIATLTIVLTTIGFVINIWFNTSGVIIDSNIERIYPIYGWIALGILVLVYLVQVMFLQNDHYQPIPKDKMNPYIIVAAIVLLIESKFGTIGMASFEGASITEKLISMNGLVVLATFIVIILALITLKNPTETLILTSAIISGIVSLCFGWVAIIRYVYPLFFAFAYIESQKKLGYRINGVSEVLFLFVTKALSYIYIVALLIISINQYISDTYSGSFSILPMLTPAILIPLSAIFYLLSWKKSSMALLVSGFATSLLLTFITPIVNTLSFYTQYEDLGFDSFIAEITPQLGWAVTSIISYELLLFVIAIYKMHSLKRFPSGADNSTNIKPDNRLWNFPKNLKKKATALLIIPICACLVTALIWYVPIADDQPEGSTIYTVDNP